MWDLAVREADYAAAYDMLRRFEAPPRSQVAPLSMWILQTFAQGDSAARARILAEATVADNRQSQIGARYVATYLEDVAQARRIARLDLAPRRRPAIRAGAQELLAWLALAEGRWSAAMAEFAAAERMEGAAGAIRVSRALAATLPFLAPPRSDLEAIRADLETWRPETDAPWDSPGLPAALREHLRLYLLGLLHARLGHDAQAFRSAAALDSLPTPLDARATTHALAQTIRADVAWRNGRTEEALDLLAPVRGDVPLELVSVPFYSNVRAYSQEHARYLRAELLYRLGRDADALRWFDASLQGSPLELVYLAPLHLRRGQIYERLGESAKAAEHYRRFVALWKDCDPELRGQVEDAASRLARLK